MGKPRWQREVIQDHKFDFIDVKSFTAHGMLLWAGYAWVFIDVFKSLAVYAIDTQTGTHPSTTTNVAIFLLAFNKWASTVKPAISISISRWIFSGCIIFSFLLLAKDWYSARRIIRSRDISFAYTNVLANRWYSIRGGYAYYCLFDRLGDSRHAWDSIAFFVFFSFKGIPFISMVDIGWKRLLLAEGPRQVLNAITLYSVVKDTDFSFDISVYQKKYTTVQGVVMSFMLLTVTIWALSFIRLLFAGLLYWPLLCCHIRGNLKEYCCHKVDKRITKILLAKRQKQRDQRQPEKKGTMTIADMAEGKGQPTLPKVEFKDGDGDSVISLPLYPLNRSDTADSRAGLLQRSDSASSNSTNPYLTRTNTGLSDSRSLARTNTDRSQPSLPRQPTLPHLVSDFSVPKNPVHQPPEVQQPLAPSPESIPICPHPNVQGLQIPRDQHPMVRHQGV